MAPIAGFNFKVRINSSVFSCTRYSVRDRATGQDITNSEGTTGSGAAATPGFETRIAPNRAAEVQIDNASWDPNEDVFAAPRSVISGTYAAVRIYLNGLAGPFWDFPKLYLDSVEQTGDAKTLQPITIRGTTDGTYTMPT